MNRENRSKKVSEKIPRPKKSRILCLSECGICFYKNIKEKQTQAQGSLLPTSSLSRRTKKNIYERKQWERRRLCFFLVFNFFFLLLRALELFDSEEEKINRIFLGILHRRRRNLKFIHKNGTLWRMSNIVFLMQGRIHVRLFSFLLSLCV